MRYELTNYGQGYRDGYKAARKELEIEAFEKSIPQKPHKATTRYNEFIRFECPVCGGFLIKNYPCKCGQMIDWSEEE